MKNNLFNSTLEMELRVLLLLSSNQKALFSIDRLISLDFITCYAEQFQLPYENLHGDNDYMYSELVTRRMMIQEAVKSLVRQGLIDVKVNQGYLYSVSESGSEYINSLNSEYSSQYRVIAREAIKVFKKYSDLELDVVINDNAARSIRRR